MATRGKGGYGMAEPDRASMPRYLVILTLLIASAVGHAQDVEISGGPDEDEHNYTWTVTNNADQAIVRLTFPHYQCDLATAPEGWSFEMTQQVGQGGGDDIGRVTFTPDFVFNALRPRQSRKFGVRVAPAGLAEPAAKPVTVEFADGTIMKVGGVICPMPEPWLQKNIPAIGLGGTFLLFLLFAHLARRRERRKSRPATADDGTTPSEGTPTQP